MTGLRIESFGPGAARDRQRRFVEVGLRLQRADPTRIPAAGSSVALKLRGDFHFYGYGDARFLLATREGRDVGRAAAIRNDHTDVGYIGLYECEDDPPAATALLDAACDWLRAQGRHRAAGPVDFSTWYTYRFSVPREPAPEAFWLEPVTSDHCLRQWRDHGFRPRHRYVSTCAQAGPHLRAREALDRAADEGIAFRTLDLDNLERELRVLHELSLRGFASAKLFTPIDWPEFRDSYAGLRSVVRPELVAFATDGPGGDEVAFAFNVPNYARAARAMDGGSSLPARLRFLLRRGRPRELLLKTLMVVPEYQHTSAGEALFEWSYRAGLDAGYERFVHALMHAGNLGVLAQVGRSNPSELRRYVVLERDLA